MTTSIPLHMKLKPYSFGSPKIVLEENTRNSSKNQDGRVNFLCGTKKESGPSPLIYPDGRREGPVFKFPADYFISWLTSRDCLMSHSFWERST